MAENKKSFVGYADWGDTFEMLDDVEAGKLIKHFFKYIQDENPVLEDKLLQVAFHPIKLQLKRDLVKWDEIKVKRSDAGKKSSEIKKLNNYVDSTSTHSTSVDFVEPNSTSVDFVKTDSTKSTVTVTVNDTVNVINRANALTVAKPPEVNQQELKNEFKELIVGITGKELKIVVAELKTFISDKKPEFIEPYQEYWNLFAENYQLPEIKVINDARFRKFKTRVREPDFDFLKVLEKIKCSKQLRGQSDSSNGWKVTFDWVFENQSNYVKILEGNYDTN